MDCLYPSLSIYLAAAWNQACCECSCIWINYTENGYKSEIKGCMKTELVKIKLIWDSVGVVLIVDWRSLSFLIGKRRLTQSLVSFCGASPDSGMSAKFISSIQYLYTNIWSRVCAHGYCPLEFRVVFSHIFSILSLKCLWRTLSSCKDIGIGICTGSSYADDVLPTEDPNKLEVYRCV